jgi:hypothetical protein
MGDEWEQDPKAETGQPNYDQPNFDDLDKRIEDIKRTLVQGANEAQQRLKRVVDRANEYWQQAQPAPQPHQAADIEEQRIRELANMWSAGNWRVARELGTYMDVHSWNTDEVWEATVQTRFETRSMETVAEPYTGQTMGKPQPVLPVWDYELPETTSLKAPVTRIRLPGNDEILSCAPCNGTGHLLCATCTGRGWIVCPDCQGRTKIRCATCHGRGYIADWKATERKSFFRKQAEGLASSVNERVSDMFEGIRQQGVPIPNPLDPDPATKGPTIPCPDCVNGEVECTCGTGKRICPTCQGAKIALCTNCGGTGKIVRHREIVRQFDLRTQSQIVGNSAIPQEDLSKASGELVYNAEIKEPLYAEAVPENVPADVWRVAVEMAKGAATDGDVARPRASQSASRPTLQVLELVRIPYTRVAYRYADQDYTLYIYDSEGKEKFYADRFPARWDRIERLVRSITNDLMAPYPGSPQPGTDNPNAGNQARGYRVPIETPPYSITEEDMD